jgi:hypothetical protein
MVKTILLQYDHPTAYELVNSPPTTTHLKITVKEEAI